MENDIKVFQNYKENQTEKNFKEILKLIKKKKKKLDGAAHCVNIFIW